MTTTEPTTTQPHLHRTQLESGLGMAYAEYGAPGGETLVLLHGFTDSWFSFSRLLPLLDPGRYHAFALDQRGHGDSDRPPCCYSMDDFAADVVGFLDAVGDPRATLVGHSMGTVVARRVATLHPDRVDRLVLLGSSMTFRTEAALAFRRELESLSDPVPDDFARGFQESTGHVPIPAAFLDRVVAESLKLPARVWRDALDGVLAADDERQLGSVEAPTLVVWGTEDPYFGREQQDRLVAAIPGARLLAYPDTGHNPHWERPEATAYDLATFLNQGSSGATAP